MELEFFKKLPLDEYFHDLERGYEFKKVAQSDTYCTCQCTRKIPFDETTVKVGEILSIDFDAVDIEDLALGKYPDNSKHLYIKTEQHSSELKTMLIADAQKQGLKVGDKVWVQLDIIEFPDECDKHFKTKHPVSGSHIIFRKDTTEIMFTKPQPFVPKHDEICKFEHQSGNIIKCKAIHTEGQICAVSVEKCALGYMFYNADKIKQFFPIE